MTRHGIQVVRYAAKGAGDVSLIHACDRALAGEASARAEVEQGRDRLARRACSGMARLVRQVLEEVLP